MRTIRTICILAAVALTLSACQSTEKQAATPAEVCSQIGFAWNLGNHFDSFPYQEGATPATAWYWDGKTPTEELYRNLAEAGVKTVRIPVTWGPWQSEAPDYTIDPDFIALVMQNIHWAKDNGLNVILNLHHDEYWLDIYNAATDSAVNAAIMQRIERTWAQVADAVKDEGHYLFLEAFNEIHAKTADMEDWSGMWYRGSETAPQLVNDWNALAVRTIRATGSVNANRWIVLNAYCGSAEAALVHLVFPEDPAGRLMLSVHNYSPVDFALEDKCELWGVGEQKEADEQAIVDFFAPLYDKFISQGIPVYLGEFGCVAHATAEGEACRLRYLTMMAEEAHKVQIPVIIWDNAIPGAGAEHHSYFDHNDGHITEGAEAIIAALTAIYQ